jgi:hypothetical protein
MGIIASSIHGSLITPADVAKKDPSLNAGRAGGSFQGQMPGTLGKLGIPGAKLTGGISAEAAKKLFREGNVIAGHVPGHFISVLGISESGDKMIVSDSSNAANSDRYIQPWGREAGGKGRRMDERQVIVPVPAITGKSTAGLKMKSVLPGFNKGGLVRYARGGVVGSGDRSITNRLIADDNKETVESMNTLKSIERLLQRIAENGGGIKKLQIGGKEISDFMLKSMNEEALGS